jgi:hypothetical protein
MVYVVPDVNAGTALPFYMVKGAFDAEGLQGFLDIASGVTPYKAGGHYLCPGNSGGLGHIQSLAPGGVGTFRYPVYLTHAGIGNHVTFIYRCI